MSAAYQFADYKEERMALMTVIDMLERQADHIRRKRSLRLSEKAMMLADATRYRAAVKLAIARLDIEIKQMA